MTQNEYLAVLKLCGGRIELYAPGARYNLLQAWREVYAAPLFDLKGQWRLGPFDWHVFSFCVTRSWRGEPAVSMYSRERAEVMIVVPEDARLPAVKVIKGRPPDFSDKRADVYVWPEDLTWTIAFTHQKSLGLGPYFSRREWVIRRAPQPDRKPAKARRKAPQPRRPTKRPRRKKTDSGRS